MCIKLAILLTLLQLSLDMVALLHVLSGSSSSRSSSITFLLNNEVEQ
jgi:hypothetical protein